MERNEDCSTCIIQKRIGRVGMGGSEHPSVRQVESAKRRTADLIRKFCTPCLSGEVMVDQIKGVIYERKTDTETGQNL